MTLAVLVGLAGCSGGQPAVPSAGTATSTPIVDSSPFVLPYSPADPGSPVR